MREAGHSVWVQRAAGILHLEGLSHSRRTDQGLKQHQVRNLEQLKERWEHSLDTEQPPEGMPWLLAADRGLLGRPLAHLLQPSADAINRCRQQGYGVLVLGECPQADVFGLPLDRQVQKRWLLEQLPELASPQVVLMGTQEGEAGEMARRLQLARPQWPLVARASDLRPSWRRCAYQPYRAGTGRICASWPAPVGCTMTVGWSRRVGW